MVLQLINILKPAVSRIHNLYKQSVFISSASDKNGSPDIICVKKYDSRFKFKNGKSATAHITVKQYKNEGGMIK